MTQNPTALGSTLVIGHRNPDMDSVGSAIGYAYLLNQSNGSAGEGAATFVPARTGELNKQTAFALDYFKAESPMLVTEVEPGTSVILVDHNEPQQAVEGIERANLLGILDHHRLGTISTPVAIPVTIDTVGCTATLIMEEALRREIRFPAPIAGVLLSAILSDTLVFTSPTLTGRDKTAALKLAAMCGLENGIEEYGANLLKAGAGMGSRTAAELVNADLKLFSSGAYQFGLAQIEVAGFDELPARQAELTAYLTQLIIDQQLSLGGLLITDVISNNSRLIAVGDSRAVSALPFPVLADGTFDAPGVVSRKKQLLPAVETVFASL